jgi:hypothetical protein
MDCTSTVSTDWLKFAVPIVAVVQAFVSGFLWRQRVPMPGFAVVSSVLVGVLWIVVAWAPIQATVAVELPSAASQLPCVAQAESTSPLFTALSVGMLLVAAALTHLLLLLTRRYYQPRK